MLALIIAPVLGNRGIKKLDITLDVYFALKEFLVIPITGEEDIVLMQGLPPHRVHLDQFFQPSRILEMVDEVLKWEPAIASIDFHLVGTTSNGWRTATHPLGSVAYRQQGTARHRGSLGCATDNHADGIVALREAMGSMRREDIEAPDQAEAESREEWMALRGTV
jgi:hypothetical protein